MGKAVCEIPKHPDIISLGFVTDEDKFDGISGAKALILPSKFESLSISVLEAMTLSKPVIVNGICDVLKDTALRVMAVFITRISLNSKAVLIICLNIQMYMRLCVRMHESMLKITSSGKIL